MSDAVLANILIINKDRELIYLLNLIKNLNFVKNIKMG